MWKKLDIEAMDLDCKKLAKDIRGFDKGVRDWNLFKGLETTLKNTAKPVTDVQFPAVTICGSGFHMSNVEKKINQNFQKWRNETGRTSVEFNDIRNDMVEYMSTTFQIRPHEGDEGAANIMDILDTMVSSNVEDSVTANAVRENVVACSRKSRKKREASNCKPETIALNIVGVWNITDTYWDESRNDSTEKADADFMNSRSRGV